MINEIVSKEMIDEVMAMFSDDIVATFNPSFIGPALPIMLRGETMWIDARTVPALEQRHGCRMVIHMKRRDGMALVSRMPDVIRRASRNPYNGRWTPKHRAAMREAQYESLGQDDEWCVRDRFAQGITADEMLYGEP
jgi:hypothetical protein